MNDIAVRGLTIDEFFLDLRDLTQTESTVNDFITNLKRHITHLTFHKTRTPDQNRRCPDPESLRFILPASVTKGFSRTLFAGPSSVHFDFSVIHHFSIEHPDGVLRFFLIGHGDESESLHPSGVTIFDYLHRNHCTGLSEFCA